MADFPYQGEETEPKRAAPDGWGRSSTFLLGLAIGVVLGLLATPAGRGALVPFEWLAAIGQDGAAARPHATTAPRIKAALAGRPAPRAPTPATLPPAELRAAVQGQPMVVGVFGDSMADGLWAGLYRRLHAEGGFEVVRFSQASTGMARYNYVNMQDKTQDALDSRHLDVAILLTGTNDEQGIADGGHVYDFDTPGWRAIYERRIDALVGLLRSRGVAVYWVGLPKMEHARFDAGAAKVNAVLAGRMAALGVPFIPTTPVTVNESGQYDDYLAQPGSNRKVLMRARDGIHMTMAGYLRIAAPVADRLKADVAAVSASTASISASAASLSGASVSGASAPGPSPTGLKP